MKPRPIAIAMPNAVLTPVKARKYRLSRDAASSSAFVVRSRSWEPMSPMNRSRRSRRCSRMKITKTMTIPIVASGGRSAATMLRRISTGPGAGSCTSTCMRARSADGIAAAPCDAGVETADLLRLLSRPWRASAAFSTTPLVKSELLTASSFFVMTIWYCGRFSPSCATCLPMMAPRANRIAKASATASRTDATLPIRRRVNASAIGAKTKLRSTAMAIGTSTSRPKDNPTIMAATMMIVSVACARLPKSARGPLNGLIACSALFARFHPS